MAERLTLLVDEGVLTRISAPNGRDAYVLAEKGRRLWPTIWSLITWGNENYLQTSIRRAYKHVGCGGTIRADAVCSKCRQQPEAGDLIVHPPRHPVTG